jgi:undecaprenyl phosphate N,N'-diacetylbacillosamine 1-phosphate transferase
MLSPFLFVVALWVRIKLGAPVIFRQMRPGRDEQLFPLFKFRTMTEDRDAAGSLLPDNLRLTPTGKFLRRTSLDELPELINVVRGEMSMIGPRPLLARYLPYFSKHERIRFTVRPGISGLAQVSGRNTLSWKERLQRDIQYVECLSVAGDVRILWATMLCVLRCDGYESDPNAVMLDFDAERKLHPETKR